MKVKKATDVFGEWAEKGKDVGMEEGHAIAVNEMLNFGLKERQNLEKNFKNRERENVLFKCFRLAWHYERTI